MLWNQNQKAVSHISQLDMFCKLIQQSQEWNGHQVSAYYTIHL